MSAGHDLHDAQRRLRESERRFRSLAAAARAIVWHADPRGAFRHAPGWSDLTGQGEGDYAGDGWLDAVHHDERAAVEHAWSRARARREELEIECRLRTRSGAYRYVAIRSVPVIELDGDVIEWVGMVSDVHNRRHAQAMLAAREQEMRLILDNTDARIAYVTAEGRFRWANQAFLDWHRRAQHEVAGAPLRDVLPMPALRDWERRIAQARGGRTEQFESRDAHPVLGERWSLNTVTPDLAADGALEGCIVLAVDTTARREMEEAMRRSEAQHRARAAAQTQEFLAMLSHELRNPLTAITMAAQLLDEPGAREAQRRLARGTLLRQSQLLRRVVDDLLETARVTHGHIELKRTVVDLRQLVEALAIDLSPRLERDGVVLRIAVPPGAYVVHADPARLQQIVDNLVSNAARASLPGGEVTLALAHEPDGGTRIAVADRGHGIDPTLLHHLFEPFVRGETDQRQGLGLGLTIVRRLAELHGGRVTAASAGRGQGATFALHLPASATFDPARVPIPEAATEAARAGFATAVSKADVVARGVGEAPASQGSHAAAGSHRGRVLVIDDERESTDALEAVLELHGYEVAKAYDATAGLERWRSFGPEVIVCDLGLPEPLDGYDVAMRIVAEAGDERPYLVAFSGYGRPEDVDRSRRAGFDEHLLKPASVTDVLARVAAGMRRRERA